MRVVSILPPLTDNPMEHLDEDRFGFRPYVEALDELVALAEPLPCVVGIFGPWGSGKSSFLRMWRSLIGTRSRTSQFNPWKYDQKVEVWAALIQSILAELKESTSSPQRITELARQIAWLTLRGGLSRGIGLATAGIINEKTVDKALDVIADRDAKFYKFMNEYEYAFTKAVDEYVGEDGRLVVFVDDLDRCTPESALAVLEALKLFIGNARCVFVLAMDFDLVAAAVGSKLGSHDPLNGAAYLEKIVQIPFFLPDVSFETLRVSVGQHVGGLAKNEAFWELVQIGFGANPRRVKRYINVLNLATAILKLDDASQSGAKQRLQLAELLIIRSEHREFFRYLTKHPDAWLRLEEALTPPLKRGAVVTVDHDNLPGDLKRFAQDEALLRLLGTKPGAYLDHPEAASETDTERMLGTVRLAVGPLEEQP